MNTWALLLVICGCFAIKFYKICRCTRSNRRRYSGQSGQSSYGSISLLLSSARMGKYFMNLRCIKCFSHASWNATQILNENVLCCISFRSVTAAPIVTKTGPTTSSSTTCLTSRTRTLPIATTAPGLVLAFARIRGLASTMIFGAMESTTATTFLMNLQRTATFAMVLICYSDVSMKGWTGEIFNFCFRKGCLHLLGKT